MLADREWCQAAEDRLRWRNVDDWLGACIVKLFRACKRHTLQPGRHPAANHVKSNAGVLAAQHPRYALTTYLAHPLRFSCVYFVRTMQTCVAAGLAH